MNNANTRHAIDGLCPIRPRRLTFGQLVHRELHRPRTVSLAQVLGVAAYGALGGAGAVAIAHIIVMALV